MQTANYRNVATNLTSGNLALLFPNGIIDNGKTLNAGVNATNTDTVTINGKVYTFLSSLTTADGAVFIGATAAATLFNFYSAVMLLSGAGTLYGTLTTAPADFYAEKPLLTGTVMTFRPIAANGTLTVAEGMTNAANVWQESWNVFLGSGRVKKVIVSCPALATLDAAFEVWLLDAMIDATNAHQRGGDGHTREYLAKMTGALTASRGVAGDPWFNSASGTLPADLLGCRVVWGPQRANQGGRDSGDVSAAVQRPFEFDLDVKCVGGMVLVATPRANLTAAAATPLDITVEYEPDVKGGDRRRQVANAQYVPSL